MNCATESPKIENWLDCDDDCDGCCVVVGIGGDVFLCCEADVCCPPYEDDDDGVMPYVDVDDCWP